MFSAGDGRIDIGGTNNSDVIQINNQDVRVRGPLRDDAGDEFKARDLAEYGADVHWYDLEGETDDAKMDAFQLMREEDTEDKINTLYIPGIKIILNRLHSFGLFYKDGDADGLGKRAAGLVGPDASRGGNRAQIIVRGGDGEDKVEPWTGGEIGLWFQGGVRARNIRFGMWR